MYQALLWRRRMRRWRRGDGRSAWRPMRCLRRTRATTMDSRRLSRSDAAEEEEAERRYRLELSRELQVRHGSALMFL